MKTNHNLRNIQRLILMSAILAFLNIGVAQNYYVSAGTLMPAFSMMKSGNDLENSALSSEYSIARPILEQMDQNPEYWVDYLNTTVNEETEAPAPASGRTSGVLQLMDSDPLYWFNYLKENVEDEIEPAEGVLDNMENDPLYWPHFLQNTVNTDTI